MMVDRYDSSDVELLLSEEDEFGHLVQISRELAHELNNLLTTILTNTQLVMLIAKEEELMPHLKSVEDAVCEMGTIVRDFQKSVQAYDRKIG